MSIKRRLGDVSQAKYCDLKITNLGKMNKKMMRSEERRVLFFSSQSTAIYFVDIGEIIVTRIKSSFFVVNQIQETSLSLSQFSEMFALPYPLQIHV